MNSLLGLGVLLNCGLQECGQVASHFECPEQIDSSKASLIFVMDSCFHLWCHEEEKDQVLGLHKIVTKAEKMRQPSVLKGWWRIPSVALLYCTKMHSKWSLTLKNSKQDTKRKFESRPISKSSLVQL